MTEQPPTPTIITGMACASTERFTSETEKSYYYSLKCDPCDVKWRSADMAEECWSCGEKRYQWK